MLKKASMPLFAVFFIASGFLRAQDAPDEAIAIASARYVKVESNAIKVKKDGALETTTDVNDQATGFRIGGDYVLTNFHALTRNNVCLVNGMAVRYVKVAPELDIILVEAAFPNKLPWVRIADAHVGETIYGWSNSDGLGGFLSRYFVSKVDERYLYLQEPTIPGGSGTGLVNGKGELVGIAMQDVVSNNGSRLLVRYGEAIPASVLREFLKGYLPTAQISSPPAR